MRRGGGAQDEDGSGVARSSEEVASDKSAHAGKGLRGDIEGLRAIAVGTVLIYHVGVPWMSGGYAGVDIFFVISGFLITSLLLRETVRTGSVSLANFYARRARRLLPAASVVLIFTGVVGWFVLPGAEKSTLGGDVIAATFYVINWALAFRSVDYLAEDAAPSALQHYWSLSVEEQYYLLWPLVILAGLLVARRLGLRVKPLLFAVLGAIAAASFVYSIVHTASSPATAYFFTTTRVWELALGALVAFLVVRLRDLPRPVAEILAVAGLALILVAVFTFDETTAWPGSMALVPTLGAAAIIAAGCGRTDTLTARALSIRPMQWIGGLSYSIYLWHWPLIIFARELRPEIRVRELILVGLLSVALAWVTKHLIEDPVRFHRGLGARPRRGLLFGAAIMAATGALGLVLHIAAPDYDRDAPVSGAMSLVADPAAAEWTVREDLSAQLTSSGETVPPASLAVEDVPTYYDDDCQVQQGDPQVPDDCSYGDLEGERTIAMLGDSKMGQYFPSFEYIAGQEEMRLDLYLKSACSFSLGGVAEDCQQFGRNVLDHFVAEGAPDIAVVSQGSPQGETLQAGMTEALSELRAMGTTVVVIADSPRPTGGPVYECVEDSDDYADCGFASGGEGEGREGRGTPPLRAAAEESGVNFLDPNGWICPEGLEQCPAVIGESMIYRQGSHVTASYSRSLTPILYRALAELDLTERAPADITVDEVP